MARCWQRHLDHLTVDQLDPFVGTEHPRPDHAIEVVDVEAAALQDSGGSYHHGSSHHVERAGPNRAGTREKTAAGQSASPAPGSGRYGPTTPVPKLETSRFRALTPGAIVAHWS